MLGDGSDPNEAPRLPPSECPDEGGGSRKIGVEIAKGGVGSEKWGVDIVNLFKYGGSPSFRQ